MNLNEFALLPVTDTLAFLVFTQPAHFDERDVTMRTPYIGELLILFNVDRAFLFQYIEVCRDLTGSSLAGIVDNLENSLVPLIEARPALGTPAGQECILFNFTPCHQGL
jgi:hypothetical protein